MKQKRDNTIILLLIIVAIFIFSGALQSCVAIDNGEEDAFVCYQINESKDGYIISYMDNPRSHGHSVVRFYTTNEPSVSIGDTLKGW